MVIRIHQRKLSFTLVSTITIFLTLLCNDQFSYHSICHRHLLVYVVIIEFPIGFSVSHGGKNNTY
jgi:hypothetical protein